MFNETLQNRRIFVVLFLQFSNLLQKKILHESDRKIASLLHPKWLYLTIKPLILFNLIEESTIIFIFADGLMMIWSAITPYRWKSIKMGYSFDDSCKFK
jgi:hypothetical protein